jgi:hypothetical protein
MGQVKYYTPLFCNINDGESGKQFGEGDSLAQVALIRKLWSERGQTQSNYNQSGQQPLLGYETAICDQDRLLLGQFKSGGHSKDKPFGVVKSYFLREFSVRNLPWLGA